MDSKRLGRLHWLMDQQEDRELTTTEQVEYDSLCNKWNDDQWNYIRQMNAAANIPLDTEPWSEK